MLGHLPNWRAGADLFGFCWLSLTAGQLSAREESLAGWVRHAINFYPLISIVVNL
jgi:hypothetical protein